MNIKEIVIEYLKANSFDGLFKPEECACKLNDLMPCDSPCDQCEPGYVLPGNEDYDWRIGMKESEAKKYE